MALAIGIDIGGTEVAVGAVDEQAAHRQCPPGHGVSAAGELPREPAMRTLQERTTARAYREVPTVRIAELGPEAGIAGAADLARHG